MKFFLNWISIKDGNRVREIFRMIISRVRQGRVWTIFGEKFGSTTHWTKTKNYVCKLLLEILISRLKWEEQMWTILVSKLGSKTHIKSQNNKIELFLVTKLGRTMNIEPKSKFLLRNSFWKKFRMLISRLKIEFKQALISKSESKMQL